MLPNSYSGLLIFLSPTSIETNYKPVFSMTGPLAKLFLFSPLWHLRALTKRHLLYILSLLEKVEIALCPIFLTAVL